MKKYIKTIENKRISELNNYLFELGFNDCSLDEEEVKLLNISKIKISRILSVGQGSGDFFS